jgi:hypothetical protein
VIDESHRVIETPDTSKATHFAQTVNSVKGIILYDSNIKTHPFIHASQSRVEETKKQTQTTQQVEKERHSFSSLVRTSLFYSQEEALSTGIPLLLVRKQASLVRRTHSSRAGDPLFTSLERQQTCLLQILILQVSTQAPRFHSHQSR